jgi:DNA-binding beta-propeller fold protein YncE
MNNFGSSDGIGTSASFYGPTGIAIDSNGNLYVADTNNHIIRLISATGIRHGDASDSQYQFTQEFLFSDAPVRRSVNFCRDGWCPWEY